MRQAATDFARDDRGAVLVFFAVAMVIFFGFAALTFDLGRTASTQSDLQSFADHVALTAAGELDGRVDAIDRSTAAAGALLTGRQTFGVGDQLLDAADFQLFFHQTLPENDALPMPRPGLSPTDGARARYVEVVVDSRRVQMTFFRVFQSLRGAAQGADPEVGATAVAGFTSLACDVAPLFMCVPDSNWRAEEQIGTRILARTGGGPGSAYGPGNFGFLDPAENAGVGGPCDGLNGANRDRCLVGGSQAVAACFRQDGVDTDTGQRQGLTPASLNVRFDIYSGWFGGGQRRSNALFAPAPNVVLGGPAGPVRSCGGGQGGGNQPIGGGTARLPVPSDLGPGNRFGSPADATEINAYIAANHDNDSGLITAYQDALATNGAPLYSMYLAEIARAGGSTSAAMTTDILPADRWESGRPICWGSSGNNTTNWNSQSINLDPNRRVLVIAAIDCAANNIQGNSRGVPVQEFVRVFMTRPAGGNDFENDDDNNGNSGFDIVLEVIGTASRTGAGGSEGIVRDFVQLYR